MIVEVNDVAFHYRSDPVLRNVSFSVKRNELLAIMGPNGVGKTTLLKCINSILRPSCGSIIVENEDVTKLDRLEIARRLGYVPQRSEPARLTAFDAILLGRRPHMRWNVTERDLKLVDAAMKLLSLEKLSLRYIDEMSGGELQKVAIARALVQEPKILLFDEPTASLDLKNQLEILRIIGHIVHGHDMAAVMTIHDINNALRYADKFLFLRDGCVYAACAREDVTPEIIGAVYGVSVEIFSHNDRPFVLPVE